MHPLVNEFCADRYSKHKNPCSACEIREACHSGPQLLTWQTLQEWQDRCYDAVIKATKETHQ